jgi:hypothetical protein
VPRPKPGGSCVLNQLFAIWTVAILLLAGGCNCQAGKTDPADPTPPAKTEKQEPSPAKTEPGKPCGKTNADFGWPADFQPPLDIKVEPPEVPEKIRGPSPPIGK